MIRDANGDWGTVVYDATDPRRATFYRAASQSSVFNPVTGEFDGSSSVSGDSEVTVTGHETNETPAEKNRFERNLETIFVDAGSSLTPPDDEEDASSEYDDTVYAVNTAPPGSVWGAAASGFRAFRGGCGFCASGSRCGPTVRSRKRGVFGRTVTARRCLPTRLHCWPARRTST
jgi:hypothetical protein